jgi:hypothetical protein
VRSTVGESFGSFCAYQSQHHVVANSFDPCDAHVMEARMRILSIIGDLTNSALYSVACIIAPNNLKCKRTRPELVQVVKDHLTNYLLDASRESDGLCQLSKLFKNPNSYLHKNLQIVTPVTKHLLVSISKTLERLDELTIRELYATFRRLSGVKVKPHFPPALTKKHYSTQSFLLRVKKLCHEYLSSLQEGQEMPKEFANGLTVVILSIYSRLGHTTIPVSEFRHFPKEVMCTQMEILHAVWLLHKLQIEDIKTLIPLIDPTGTVPRLSFTIALKKYLIEWLFVCDEISIPKELLKAVDLINKRAQVETNLFSEENKAQEFEAVLNVSCYLKSVSTNLILEKVNEGNVDVEVASEGYDEEKKNWCSENNDFEFCGTDYFFNSVGEGLGKVMEVASSNCISESVDSAKGCSFSTDSCKIPKKSSEKPIGGSHACSSTIESEIELNVICDEVALVAHKLVGHVIAGFLKLEERKADKLTLSYLTDGSNANNHRGSCFDNCQ